MSRLSIKSLCISLGLAVLPSLIVAQRYFDYNQDINRAYTEIVNLHFDKGQQILDSLKVSTPNNLAVYHIENYIDFFTVFIYERDTDFEKLKQNKKTRLQYLDQGDPSDPYTAFAQAEIILQWALLRSKFDELITSARELYQAYGILEYGKTQHPDFVLYNKSLSIIHALIESVPISDFLKSIIGISGSIELGVAEIEALLSSKHPLFGQEAEVIRAFIQLYQENQPEQAWSYYSTTKVAKNKSSLAKFVGIKIAQRSGRNDEALAILSTLSAQQMSEFPYLNFLKGLSLLRNLDSSSAKHLRQFVTTFQGRHYIKEAYQKLAWYELVINNNMAGYKTQMNACRQKGYKLIDDDKQAQKEAESGTIPHPDLLKARLLFDGGYNQRAFSQLVKSAHLFVQKDILRAEYLYRLGRITQMLYSYHDAIEYYREVVEQPAYATTFYACNAALQIGIIYECQGNTTLAKQYFEKCLAIYPDEYQQSLHQKAKSGLQRINQH